MAQVSQSSTAEVFISYASQDRERVTAIARRLEDAGIQTWLDQNQIPGGANFGTEIVHAIKNCKVLMLMCSDASLRSKNVKQEIQLAWKYDRPYLPLLLERISFPEQVQYWLEGAQWIEVLDHPHERWLPRVLQALSNIGVGQGVSIVTDNTSIPVIQPIQTKRGLEGLLSLARFTDQIWPILTKQVQQRTVHSSNRGLGAPQYAVNHQFQMGSHISIAIESERRGNLLLLNEGADGIIYCLCPSWFAPDAVLPRGRSYLPQKGSRYDSFVVSGKPGREHLLAVISDEPLGLEWMPPDPTYPSRVLNTEDIDTLLMKLHDLSENHWTVLSTYFDVFP